MKKDLLDIFDKTLASHKHKAVLISYAAGLIDFYEGTRNSATANFQRLLEKYNFETLTLFSEYPSYPHVTLFHGSGQLEFVPVIAYTNHGVTDMDQEIGVIVHEPTFWPEEIGFDSPIYAELDGWQYKIRHSITFTFLCTIWQAIEGHKYGIITKTLENNSSRQFMFNDLSWQDLSTFGFYDDVNATVNRYFQRDLTVFELYQRVNFVTYPFNPYENRWRIFEKEAASVEISGWGNEVAERINEGELIVTTKKDLKERLLWEKNKSDELIITGFEEFFYSKSKEQIHPEAIEFGFHSGIHWYSKELQNRIDIKSIEQLEQKLGITFPFHFKQYLRLFNGRKFNKHCTTFQVNEAETVQVKDFHNLAELERENFEAQTFLQKIFPREGRRNDWLKIGVTENDENLLLGVNEDSNHGKLKIEKDDRDVKNIDFVFSEFIKRIVRG